jgi:hypothetical protein
MKKYFALIIALLAFALNAVGQDFKEIVLISTTNSTATDTVTNTGVRTVRTGASQGYWATAGVGVTVTKISGTVAGVVRLMGSYDGTNFFRINPTDSLIATNVTTNYKSFTITGGMPYKYLGVQYTGSGIMAAKLTAYGLLKRPK